jgi:hypothetical protein
MSAVINTGEWLRPVQTPEPLPDVLDRELRAAGVPRRTREAVVARTRIVVENVDGAIARLRAEGTLPPAPDVAEPSPEVVEEIGARMPAGLTEDEQAEVLRISLDARADR